MINEDEKKMAEETENTSVIWKYEIGDIACLNDNLPTKCTDYGYAVYLNNGNEKRFAFHAKKEHPKLRIVDTFYRGGGLFKMYVVEEVLLNEDKSERFLVIKEDFERSTKFVIDTKNTPIRKYKKVVRVCADELAEILSLPFVDSITPLRFYFREKDIMWSPLWNSNGGAADCVDNYEASDFVVNTSLYSVPIRFGYFVQDACDGWRWMSDKDYEKHKDDIVTI